MGYALLLFNQSLNAQKMYVVDGLVFEQYNHEYGLSNNNVLSFKKDSNDFLWIGTNDGLNVLDGEKVQLFKGYQNDNNFFKGKFTHSIFEDSHQNIFCGTRNSGLNIYDRSKGHFINIDEALLQDAQSRLIKSIIEIANLQYALLTEKEIIYFSLNSENAIIETSIQELPLNDREFTTKLLIFNNEIYLNTNKRLLKVEGNEFSLIYSHKWLKHSKIRNGKFWVMNEEQIGYFSEDFKSINWIDYKFIIKPQYDNDYFIDFDVSSNNKEIWIGTRHQLIQLKLNNDNSLLSSREIESIVRIKTVTMDALQNVFITTNGNKGLIKIDGGQHQYEYIKFPKGFEKENRQHNFNEDNEGNYWISGNTGIFKYNIKSKTYHKWNNESYKALPHLKINGQIKDRNGKLWFGTANGIADYDAKKNSFNFYGDNADNYWQSFTHHLTLDKDDHLWYLTDGRLNRIDKTSKTHTFFESDKIHTLYIDKDNFLWATNGAMELVKYNINSGVPKPIKTYFIAEELRDYITHNIFEDKFGRFWIVSFNGIYVYDRDAEKVVYHINKNNLLHHELLYGITPDNRGNFWVVQSFKPAICISSETFEIIETSPNWMRREGNTEIFSGPTAIDDNGKNFTDGTGGFFVYHSDSLKVNEQPPKVILQGLSLNGTERFNNFLGSNNLSFENLKYDENNITLNLKAVNPATTYKTLYAYRLLGNSNEWNYTKNLKTVNYNGLPPNKYELQVKSTSNGDYWSQPQTLASFDIFPPWWQTTVAYLAYALLAALIIYAFYRTQLTRKLAESESQKLKEVDDFKNTFYQNITHEFRTPLTVITGLANQIKDEKSPIIKRNAEQLLNLVNELLEIGQIEANVSKLNSTIQDVVSFSKYCLESYYSLANEKNIVLEFHSNKDEIFMNYDVQKFQLILSNLISNAIKFTPKEGLIELVITENNDTVIISVKDNGTGIPADELPNVFDRYYKSNNELNAAGIGIGLSLTKELVKLMDGIITASNNEDKGTCFTMEFPLAQQAEDQVAQIDNDNSGTFEMESDQNLILVIEDNQDVRDYIISILGKRYKIISAVNGRDGIEKATESIPDIIISDVMMPFMNGYEVCEFIKNDEKTDHIPLILLTAKADKNSKIEGITTGADAYLSKPFDEKELLAHIDNLIQSREKLKKKFANEINQEATSNKPLSHVFLRKIQDLILAHLDDDSFGINEVCNGLGISRTQLHRKVKALTGLSTSIFLREIRLNEAYKLLINSELTISEIAYQTGFSDPNYFSKVFSKKYELTPTQIKNHS